jgi:EAL domain-containing protein (putative c-di-GMP-specific phosphodiesterase class I)/FixJ family two-component response regulator
MLNGRLLVLDDDLAVAQTIAWIAEETGLETRIACEPAQFFRDFGEWCPTHIALDLVMPEMDGVEVMRMLALNGCSAQIIITSGVGGRILDAAKRSATEHGLNVVGIVSKPFSAAELRALLATEQAAVAPTGRAGTGNTGFVPDLAELQRALDAREFVLAYQPKIVCGSHQLAGFEALVRWQHPRAGLIMPDRFIPLAESTGLIDPLTEQVFEQALAWFSGICSGTQLSLSINISARSLIDFQLAEFISGLCARNSIFPDQLILELTETSAMDDPVTSLDLLTRLRMRGFQLSIDDFGTGYSSMVQLVRLPFSEMKVDKSFVMNAMASQESRTVIRSIVDLGHSLGLRLTAEGVEDQGALDYLTSIGCDLAQGYFIARPMSGDAARHWQPATGPA